MRFVRTQNIFKLRFEILTSCQDLYWVLFAGVTCEYVTAGYYTGYSWYICYDRILLVTMQWLLWLLPDTIPVTHGKFVTTG